MYHFLFYYADVFFAQNNIVWNRIPNSPICLLMIFGNIIFTSKFLFFFGVFHRENYVWQRFTVSIKLVSEPYVSDSSNLYSPGAKKKYSSVEIFGCVYHLNLLLCNIEACRIVCKLSMKRNTLSVRGLSALLFCTKKYDRIKPRFKEKCLTAHQKRVCISGKKFAAEQKIRTH